MSKIFVFSVSFLTWLIRNARLELFLFALIYVIWGLYFVKQQENISKVTFHFIFNRLLYYVLQSKYFWPKASLIVLDPDLALPKEDVVEAKAEVGHQG